MSSLFCKVCNAVPDIMFAFDIVRRPRATGKELGLVRGRVCNLLYSRFKGLPDYAYYNLAVNICDGKQKSRDELIVYLFHQIKYYQKLQKLRSYGVF